MTLAEIKTAVRNLLNVQSTDTGATLTDSILTEMINDAAEEVVLDLLPSMPLQFCTTENITLEVGTASYALSTEFIQVYKVERNVADSEPLELEIIDPLDVQNYMDVGETSAAPVVCYFMGSSIYFVPTPSAAVNDYCKVYLVVPEATSVPANGPTYIPRIAHRLIVYKSAANVAIMYDVNPAPHIALYKKRISAIGSTWAGRFHERQRWVRKQGANITTKDYRWD